MESSSPLEPSVETSERNWLVLRYPNNPPIRLDVRILDRVFAADAALYLTVETHTVALTIVSGPTAAARIAEALAPYTRSAAITSQEGYEDGKRRLDLASRNVADNAAFALYLGSPDIFYSKGNFCLGDTGICSLDEVITLSANRSVVSFAHPKEWPVFRLSFLC